MFLLFFLGVFFLIALDYVLEFVLRKSSVFGFVILGDFLNISLALLF